MLEDARLDYVTADIHAQDVDVNLDVTNIPFEDASFDVVICNHVLEHVDDDRRAMRELRRVLTPEGWALLQSPVDRAREATYEDPTALTEDERLERFGQADHVRIYGLDYVDRLRAAGFDVTVERWESWLTADDVARYGLNPVEEIFLCRCARDTRGDPAA